MSVPVVAPALAQAEPQWYANNHVVSAVHQPAIVWGEIKLESGAVGKIHCMNVMNLSIWNEGGHGVGQYEGWGTNACKAPELEELLEKTYEQPIKEGKIKSPLSVFATSELPLRPEFREGEVCREESKKPSECESEAQRETLFNLTTSQPAGLHRRATSFPWKLRAVTVIREEEEITILRTGVPSEGTTCYLKEKVVEEGVEVERAVPWEKTPPGCVKIDVVCPQIPAEVVFYGTLEPQLLNGTRNGLSPTRIKYTNASGQLLSSRGEAPETYENGELKVDGMAAEELMTAK
jgi:hypothetical protein